MGDPPSDGSAAERRSIRRDERRASLIEAALVVVRRDGPTASMEQMAAEAGVTKPILYRHFGDRAGLIAAMAEQVFVSLTVALDEALRSSASLRRVTRATIDIYLEFIESDPSLYRFLAHRTIVDQDEPGIVLTEYISRAGGQVAAVLDQALRAAGLDPAPAGPWAFGIVGMVHSAGDWWMEHGSVPRDVLADQLTTLVLQGLPELRPPVSNS